MLGPTLLTFGFIIFIATLRRSKKHPEATTQKNFNNVMAFGILLIAVGVYSTLGSISNSKPKEVDRTNTNGTEVVAHVSVVEEKKEKVTDEYLQGWYDTYVKDPKFDYAVIIYKDQPAIHGVYGQKGYVQKDVELLNERDGSYTLYSDTGSTYYTEESDGKLKIK